MTPTELGAHLADIFRRLRTLETTARVPDAAAIRWPIELTATPYVVAAAAATTDTWDAGPVPVSAGAFAVDVRLERVGVTTGNPLTLQLVHAETGDVLYSHAVLPGAVSPASLHGVFPFPGDPGDPFTLRLKAVNANTSTTWRIYKPSVNFTGEANTTGVLA